MDLKDEILGLFDAERLTLYAVDAERKEIYKGRTGLHELLTATDRIKRMIQKRATAEELLKVAWKTG